MPIVTRSALGSDGSTTALWDLATVDSTSDLSGAGHPLTKVGTPILGSDANIGGGVGFNNSTANRYKTSAFVPTAGAAGTLEFIVSGEGGLWEPVSAEYFGTTLIYIDGAARTVHWFNGVTDAAASGVLIPTTWATLAYYIAFAWDASGSTVYVNGSPALTQTYAAFNFPHGSPTFEHANGQGNGSAYTRVWTGNLYRIRASNVRRNDAAIAAMYTALTTAAGSGPRRWFLEGRA